MDAGYQGGETVKKGGEIMERCEICGEPSEHDLFSAVTGERVCSICKLKFIGGLPATTGNIDEARKRLGLEDGKYLEQNNPQEAAIIMGRRPRRTGRNKPGAMPVKKENSR